DVEQEAPCDHQRDSAGSGRGQEVHRGDGNERGDYGAGDGGAGFADEDAGPQHGADEEALEQVAQAASQRDPAPTADGAALHVGTSRQRRSVADDAGQEEAQEARSEAAESAWPPEVARAPAPGSQ